MKRLIRTVQSNLYIFHETFDNHYNQKEVRLNESKITAGNRILNDTLFPGHRINLTAEIKDAGCPNEQKNCFFYCHFRCFSFRASFQ